MAKKTRSRQQKVKKAGIKRDKNYIYFVDTDGDIAKSKRGVKSRQQKVKRTRIKKQKGYLYFIDTDGDIAKSKMKRR